MCVCVCVLIKHPNMRPEIRSYGTHCELVASRRQRFYYFRFHSLNHWSSPNVIETRERENKDTQLRRFLTSSSISLFFLFKIKRIFRFSKSFSLCVFFCSLFVRSVKHVFIIAECILFGSFWKTHVRPCNRVSEQTEWQNKRKITNKEPKGQSRTKMNEKKMRKEQIASRHTHYTRENKYK